MTYKILTFGCKVNYYESEKISEKMIENGFVSSEDADIIIINSCTVTAESDRKLRQITRRIKDQNPNCFVVLTGCAVQVFSENFKNLGVNLFFDNKQKSNLPDEIAKKFLDKNKSLEISTKNPIKQRTRAFLKIQDGCDRFCTYCIIPYARNEMKSKSLGEIKQEAEILAKNGYKEIVLVGINLLLFGRDENINLVDAIQEISKISGIERIRLSSLEPELLTRDMLKKLAENSKFCPSFHLSIQSGSDKILLSMGRRYTSSEYMELIQKIRDFFGGSVTFTTDLMVGFPGETEEDFNNSLKIIEKVGFLKVHVFPFSRREGTRAANFENQITKEIKTKRVKQAIEISSTINKKVLNNFLGKIVNVLYETVDKNNFFEGYSQNYFLVKINFNEDVCGKIKKTRIIKICENYCIGEILEEGL